MQSSAVTIAATAAVVVALAAPFSARAGDEAKTSVDPHQEVTIDAEEISYDRDENSVSAAGDVVIRQGESVLRADEIKVNRTTQEAEAVGHAVLENADVTIRAQEMHINLLDETGILVGVKMRSETMGYSLKGDRIEKKEGQRYRIENGIFTSCQCSDPDDAPPWSVSGDVLDIDLDGYGEVRGGRLRINDVPVLYIPRAAFPVSRRRHSGLLFPRVGFSNRRGLQLLQPFYWAIDKSQDVTVSLDIETAQRFGLIAEHRYAIDRRSGGEMQVMYFNESIRGRANAVSIPGLRDIEIPDNRWGVIGHHSFAFGRSELYTDLMLVGDDVFLREINTFTLDESEDVSIRTRPFTTTRAGVTHRWDRAYGKLEGIFNQNLLGPETHVIQTAPKAQVSAQTQLGMGLLSSVDTSVVNFERATGIAGVRLDVFPRLELRLPLGRSLDGSISAAFRETAYGLTQDQMVGGFNGAATGVATDDVINLPSASNRESYELRGNLGTAMTRVFDFSHFGLSRIKHTIEPRLEYLYIMSTNQDDLPVFDGDDRLAARNVVSYGFTSRVLAKRDTSSSDGDDEGGSVFEIARASLVQSHDFTGQVPQIGSSTDRRSFSDLDFTMRVNPASGTSLRFESTYNPINSEITSATVGFLLREPSWLWPGVSWLGVLHRSSVHVRYRFIANNSVPGTSAVEQVDSSVTLRVTDQVGLRYAGRFNLAANRVLSNFFGFSYLSSCNCWSVDMGISDRANPNEVQFQFQMSLLGFGSAEGGSRTGMTY